MQGISFRTARLEVRTPERGDGRHYARYYTDNRSFLQPLSPTFGDDMFSSKDWEDSIPIIQHEFAAGRSARFCIFRDGVMIGVANLTSMTRSPGYSCMLGYTLSQTTQGNGYMKEALLPVIDFAFNHRNTHRITANYMPHNQRSGKLLRSLGFVVEGYARNYLLIDGKWEDHVLTSLENPRWRP